MRNILTIAKYELKRLFRDWRLVLMVLSQPIVIALIVGVTAHQEPQNIKVMVNNEDKNPYSETFIKNLEQRSSLEVERIDRFSNDELKSGRVRAVVRVSVNQTVPYHADIEIKTDPAGSIAAITAEKEIMNAASDLGKQLAADNISAMTNERTAYIQSQTSSALPSDVLALNINGENYNTVSINSVKGSDSKIQYFDYYGSSMMIILILLVVLNLSGISITSERLSGTFERIAVTPYKKIDIILGKLFALFLIGLAVNLIGIASLKIIYGITLGNVWLLSLLTVLVVGMAVSLGLFVSSVTKTVVESVELAMYVFFVSFLASGILLPQESARKVFATVENILPFYHAVDASRRINMMNAGWNNVSNDIGIVAAYMILFLLLAMISLRREAK